MFISIFQPVGEISYSIMIRCGAKKPLPDARNIEPRARSV
jgi:hypothetical protein